MVEPQKQINIEFNGTRHSISCPRAHNIEYVANEIFVRNQYPVWPFLQARADVILDVGANVGCSCLWFHELYPQATIYAFEPEPATFAFLESNTANLPRVKRFPFGCHDRPGTFPLYLGETSSATNSLASGAPFNSTKYVEITLRRLSNFLDDAALGHISILKIDTEGAEFAILSDLKSRLAQIDLIYVEYHFERDRRQIDELLSDQFSLATARANQPHRGTCGYLAKDVIARHTAFDADAIFVE